jgi:succinate dehydrogenase/fumarate reductase cytochrome b subunit
MSSKSNRFFVGLLVALVVGQGIAYLAAPESWKSFVAVLPKIISMIAFWGPIVALVSFGFVALTLRMLGFQSFEDLRRESVEENNPAPAIIFVGTLVASILFLMIVIKP